jgi:MATE family multidrug resistance protein
MSGTPTPTTPALGQIPRSALRELVSIAGPTVATMTSYTMMTFTDKWLVSRLGPEYVGAQGNGGLVSWAPQAFVYGLMQVVNTYVSQNLGAGRPRAGAAYAWNAIYLAAVCAVLMQPVAWAMPWILKTAEIDAGQAALAAEYGRVLIYGCFLNMATRGLSQFFYGMHKAGVVMVAGIVANVFNLFVSAVLVFGPDAGRYDLGVAWFGEATAWTARAVGMERGWGISGSAWGTVIATAVELAIPAAVFLSGRFAREYGTREAWRPSWGHFKDIVRLGWPGGAMFANEMACWGFFMVYLVSHFGPAHASAGWAAHQYMSLSFMPAVGMSVATTALVGKYIGMGRHDLAEHRFWLALKISAVYMGLCGVVFVVFRQPLIGLFVEARASPELAAEMVRLGSMMLIATAAFQLFDAGAMVTSGALRGAGDTVFPGIATIVASWVVIVGGGLALTHGVPEWESLGAWIAAAVYIMVLCVVLLARFMCGSWKKIRLLEKSAVGSALQAGAAGNTTDGIV